MSELPPKGLLANAALAAAQTVEEAPNSNSIITPGDAPVDPNYFEPTPLVKLHDINIKLAQLPAEELATRDCHRGKFINVLLDRICTLELALSPFAQIGMVMSNARMSLRGIGKGNEPAGGHWINQVTSTHLAPSEAKFYAAIDALGRKHTEEHMMEIFRIVQKNQAMVDDRQAHIDGGGRIH